MGTQSNIMCPGVASSSKRARRRKMNDRVCNTIDTRGFTCVHCKWPLSTCLQYVTWTNTLAIIYVVLTPRITQIYDCRNDVYEHLQTCRKAREYEERPLSTFRLGAVDGGGNQVSAKRQCLFLDYCFCFQSLLGLG